MEQNLVEAQIDEHLMTIQSSTKTTLENIRLQLEKSNLKLDKKFLNHFLKLSEDRLKQTCERYATEAKYKVPRTVKSATAPLATDNKSIPFLETDDINVSMDGDNKMKRKTGDAMDVEGDLLKRQKRMETSVNNDEIDDVDQSQLLKYARFYCVHCLDDKTPTKSVGGTFDDVSGHWLIAHLDESNRKPFQFYVVVLLCCYNCKEVGTYHDLVKHHQEKHPSTLFVVTDRMNAKKCGMCHFEDGDLVEHFQAKHDLSSTPTFFNPICYSEEQISEMFNINVTKKRRCGKCDAVFETEDEIGEHFRNSHNGDAVESSEFIDNRRTPDHFICGYCHEKVAPNRYLEHLSEHTFNFRCTVCSFQSGDLSEIVFHEKTLHDIDSLSYHCSIFPVWMKKKLLGTHMVYGNGLILRAYNLLHTKYDDSDLLDVFIHRYLDVKKERAKLLIATHEKRTNSNGSSEGNWNRSLNNANWNAGQIGADLTRIPHVLNSPNSNQNSTIDFGSIGTPPPMGIIPNATADEVERLKAFLQGLLGNALTESTSNQRELHTNPLRGDASRQLNTSAFDGEEPPPKKESTLIKELLDQQKLAKNVYVQGICRNFGTADLFKVFLKLCKEMGVTIQRSDIKKIEQCPRGITVRLQHMEIKKLIIDQTHDKYVWSNVLFKLIGRKFEKNSWKIRICEHMTTFYSKMWYKAIELKEKHRLHAFKLTEEGLRVQRTPNVSGRVVLSEQELMSYVNTI